MGLFSAAKDKCMDAVGFCAETLDNGYKSVKSLATLAIMGATGWVIVPPAYTYFVPEDQKIEETQPGASVQSYNDAMSAIDRLATIRDEYVKQSLNASVPPSKGLFSTAEEKKAKEDREAKIAEVDRVVEQNKKTMFTNMYLKQDLSEPQFKQLAQAYNQRAGFGWTVKSDKGEQIDLLHKDVKIPHDNAIAFRTECVASQPIDYKQDIAYNINGMQQCMRKMEDNRDAAQFFSGALALLIGGAAGGALAGGVGGFIGGAGTAARRRRDEKERQKRANPGRFGNN